MQRSTMSWAACLLAVAASGCQSFKSDELAIDFERSDFYDEAGKFQVERAKDAYISLMRHHGYPVFEGMREKLWVSDYGIGEFDRLGLGAVMFINQDDENLGDRYMLMDLYLLPGQMLPEHYHLATDTARPKRESWLIRHGSSFIIGEGEATEGLLEMMPESQRACATVFHAKETGPGETGTLNRATARHAQIAGPEGAIMTEVANYHDNDAVRHTNPALVFP